MDTPKDHSKGCPYQRKLYPEVVKSLLSGDLHIDETGTVLKAMTEDALDQALDELEAESDELEAEGDEK